MVEDEKKKKTFPPRNDGLGRGERGQAGPFLALCPSAVSPATTRAQGTLQALGLWYGLLTSSTRLQLT